ncbi:MAG: helix-turn-helix domain-containing protein [Candidatus Neomarinimicrobiota bacterium]
MGNIDQFLIAVMAKEGLETQEQVAELFNIAPSQISKWKARGSVPKKYLARYPDFDVAMTCKDNPRTEPQGDAMYESKDGYYVSRDPKTGLLTRMRVDDTDIVEVRIGGKWVPDTAP